MDYMETDEMTQQADWKAEREAIKARLEASLNDVHVCTTQRPDGTCECEDTQELISAEDLRRLIAKSEEDEREIRKYKTRAEGLERSHNEDIKTFERIAKSVGMDFCCCSETPELESRVRTELALREQRISDLERKAATLQNDYDHLHIIERGKVLCIRKLESELAALRKANEEIWEQAAKLVCGYCAGHFTQYKPEAERGAPGSGNWIHRDKKNHVLTALCVATGIHNKISFEGARNSREDEGK